MYTFGKHGKNKLGNYAGANVTARSNSYHMRETNMSDFLCRRRVESCQATMRYSGAEEIGMLLVRAW